MTFAWSLISVLLQLFSLKVYNEPEDEEEEDKHRKRKQQLLPKGSSEET